MNEFLSEHPAEIALLLVVGGFFVVPFLIVAAHEVYERFIR